MTFEMVVPHLGVTRRRDAFVILNNLAHTHLQATGET